MKQNKRKASGAFLILGMVFLVIGLSTDNTIFTWVSIACIVLSLVLGGRWMRPRRK
jgi:uncharacterized membrane protein HdeD (DUF308 family)